MIRRFSQTPKGSPQSVLLPVQLVGGVMTSDCCWYDRFEGALEKYIYVYSEARSSMDQETMGLAVVHCSPFQGWELLGLITLLTKWHRTDKAVTFHRPASPPPPE